jgi:hypothetical protein
MPAVSLAGVWSMAWADAVTLAQIAADLTSAESAAAVGQTVSTGPCVRL